MRPLDKVMISVDSSVDCGWIVRMRFIDFDGGNENVFYSRLLCKRCRSKNQLTLISISGIVYEVSKGAKFMQFSFKNRFRTCLKMTDTTDANMVGKLFFNIVQIKCFVLVSCCALNFKFN
jgi:hypothetical protein